MVVLCFPKKLTRLDILLRTTGLRNVCWGLIPHPQRDVVMGVFSNSSSIAHSGFSSSHPLLLDSKTSPERVKGHRGGGLLDPILTSQAALLQCQASSHFDLHIQDIIPTAISQSPSLQFGDSLSHFYSVWHTVTMDKWIPSTVRLGSEIQFLWIPPSHSFSLQGPLSQATAPSADSVSAFFRSREEVPLQQEGKGFSSSSSWSPSPREE